VLYFKVLGELWLDGVKAFSYQEKAGDAAYNDGYFGYRTTASMHAQIDSVKIERLCTSCNQTSVFDSQGKGAALELVAYPNPFNPSTILKFSNPNGFAQLSIINVTGKTIMKNKILSTNAFSWNAEGLSAGIYLASIKMDDRIVSRKITLLK
jgi:hypothetical protein